MPIGKLLRLFRVIAWTLDLFTVWLETVPSSETSVIIATGGSGAWCRLSRQDSDFMWAGAYLSRRIERDREARNLSEQGRDGKRDPELQRAVTKASDSLESKVSWCREFLSSATGQIH